MRGTGRAIFYMGRKGGASTITQQLAKLFFTQRSKSFLPRVWQKLKEWVIAIEFEKRYTKEEILAMYLNKSDFLYDAVGIGAASKTYFGKDQKSLTIEEASVLIGMLKNPRLYNPIIFPENCTNRRNVVMKQMVRNNHLTEEDYLKKRIKSINMTNFRREVHHDGIAPYFRSELTKWLKHLLNDDKYRKPDGTKYNPYVDGLKIYTTIDTRIQKYHESAVQEHMSALQNKYFSRWKGVDFITHGADKVKIDLRRKTLITMMKDSDRYKQIRAKYVSKIIAELQNNLGLDQIDDNDIFRMFEEEKNPGYIQKQKKSGTITQAQADKCTEIMGSDQWVELKSQWKKMQAAVEKSFHTKTKMTVFDYGDLGEKVVFMTPMDSIKYHLQHLQIGSISCDPTTGNILSWVGGINHKYFQYDHVNSNRQVGSTFKPIIYTTAMIEQSISPCLKVPDRKHCIEANDSNFGLTSTWCPNNADNKYGGGEITLKDALKESKNSISVYLMKLIGNVASVKNLSKNLGIDSKKIPDYPSICLGTPELSVMEMATAYTAFANEGTVTKPIFVTKIEDKNGKIIYTAVPEQKVAISPSTNYVMVNMLNYVTKGIASKFKTEIGGKTGTTNDYKDGWFVGFSPEIVIATWVGGDQEFVRFTRLEDGQGAVMARPVFEKLLVKIEADNRLGFGKNLVFTKPEEMAIEIDCSKYEALPPNDPAENSQPNDPDFGDEF
jgi:penicillin-binding protein 1A